MLSHNRSKTTTKSLQEDQEKVNSELLRELLIPSPKADNTPESLKKITDKAIQLLNDAQADSYPSQPPLKASPKIISFSGGGVLGTAHIGALIALQQMELTDTAEIAAGTSIGAVLALALALNYPATLMANKIINNVIDFKKLQDTVFPELPQSYTPSSLYKIPYFIGSLPFAITKMISQKGLCAGKHIEEVTKDLLNEVILGNSQNDLLKKVKTAIDNKAIQKQLLKDKLTYDAAANEKSILESLNKLINMLEGKAQLTFEGLHLLKLLCPEMKFKDLYVTATNVSVDPLKLEMFSYKTMPDMPIETGVHCSMAATPIYAPVEYNGTLYVDGGYLCNSPQKSFKLDETTKDKPILCVDFGKSGMYPPTQKPSDIVTFFNRLSFFPLTVAAANRSKEEHEEVIYLNDLQTCIFDFDLSTSEKMALIDKGYQQAARFLISKNFVSREHLFKLDHHYFLSLVNQYEKSNNKAKKI